MAGLVAIAQTAEVALSAATLKDVLRIKAAANHRVKVLGWGVSFDGISGTEAPVQVELLRYSTDGTYSALTPKKLDDDIAETVQTAAGHTATSTPPTPGDVLDAMEVHPQSGYEVVFPPGQEVWVRGGERLGIACTAPSAVNVRAKIKFEE